MPNKKPQPLIQSRERPRCQVCGEISYSLAGIHPQCEVKRADAIRMNRIKCDASAVTTVQVPSGFVPCQKKCPKCKALLYARKKMCGCGHTFSAGAGPPLSDGKRS
ncbi:MAG: hypothetical protein O3B13_18510 [Planctomycetota bacterium]|nr:hypothetical protein [Planctomycetota bacterium]